MNEASLRSILFCLVELLFVLDKADESQADTDFCVKIMEVVSAELQNISDTDVPKLIAMLNQIARDESREDFKRFLEDFAGNFGLRGRDG